VSAIEHALAPGVRGIFNVAGPDPLPLSRVIRLLGRPSLPVPSALGKMMLKRLWTLHLSNFPAPEIDHIRYVCMVDDRRAREIMGFLPKKTIEETVRSVDADRW
jgi:UDP-glucose 4-epimerase